MFTLFKNHSVADIISGFQKTIDKLEAASAHHSANSLVLFDIAQQHHEKGLAALDEAELADKVRAKVQALIS